MTALLGQGLDQGRIHHVAEDQDRRNGVTDVVLRQEGLQHARFGVTLHVLSLGLLGLIQCGVRLWQPDVVLDMGGEMRPIAQVAPPTHHGQVDAGSAALRHHRQHVHILVAHTFDRLLVQHGRQRGDLVAYFSRLFVLQALCVGHHAFLQVGHDHFGLTQQEALGLGHRTAIVFLTDQIDTGPAAPFDLIQQARTGSVVVDRIFASAQQEHFLQQLDGLFDRPRIWIGSKVAVLFVDRATIIGDARNVVGHDLQIRIALVVPKQDVEPRVQCLDQVVFQEQGFCLTAHHRGFHADDARDHVANARAAMVPVEIAGDAALQITRLAHIKQVILRIEIAIDPGQIGQCAHL